MRSDTRILEPEQMARLLPVLLETAEAVPLVITGSSMTPFLVHGRDTVYLSRPDRPLKRGDMVFYRRDSGAVILHRILKTGPEGYTLVGDAQTVAEPGIRPDQILALVTAVRRKGKLLGPGDFWWNFFEKVWIRMVPLRPLAGAVYCRICRLWK